MGKTIKAAVFSAAFLAAVVMGFGFGHDGLRHVATFVIWLVFVASLLLLSDDFALEAFDDPRRLPAWWVAITRVTVLAVVVYSGHWADATAYLVAIVLTEGARAKSAPEDKPA